MARSKRPDETADADADLERDATEHYRQLLAEPAPPRERHKWPPVLIGPTWQTTEDGRWLLPELTLGWGMLGWASTWLQNGRDEPWEYTLEQARALLWWYEVDDRGRFVNRDGVLQRLKGWGKDPFGATICAGEMLGPCRFSHFGDDGQPVGRDEPDAWIQTAAVSLEQTKNTMRLFPSLFTPEAKQKWHLQVLKRTVHAMDGTRIMEAVTSSPATLEGARATFLLLNETHHWDTSNDGHEMAAVIRRNAAKSPDGAARTLRITNAYDPAHDSVAQQDREAWEKAQAGGSLMTGLFYDSIEAPPEAPLSAEEAPHVARAIRGDSVWLDEVRIVQEILDTRNPPSQSRRFWYNQITAAEDAWLTPQHWDKLKDEARKLVDADPVVMFFDGSKSDDATGLVVVRLADGHVFKRGCWQRPPNTAEWTVPRDAVDGVVAETFEKYDVRGFFCDPGAGQDESGERYWDAYIDRWGNTYGKLLNIWATPTGDRRHAVMWDMASTLRQRIFTEACERVLADILAEAFTHDGDPTLRDHVRNCRRRPNGWGVSVGKEHRESSRKVDLAVCMIGARMLYRQWHALPKNKQRCLKRSGKAVFA